MNEKLTMTGTEATGRDFANFANEAFDAKHDAEENVANLKAAKKLGAVVSDELMHGHEETVRRENTRFESLVEAAGLYLDEQPNNPETTSPTAERIDERMVELSYRSAERQVAAMRAAGIPEEKIPKIPEPEEYRKEVETLLAECAKNRALELFDENELVARLSYVLDIELDGKEWSAVIRELLKNQSYVGVNEDFLAKFTSEELSGSSTDAGPRLESEGFFDGLYGTVDEQKTAHDALRRVHPDMNVVGPSMASAFASLALELERSEVEDEHGNKILKGDGVLEKTWNRLYTVDGRSVDAGDDQRVPGVLVGGGGRADAVRAWVERRDVGRLAVAKNL